ncbi:dipeptide epimerase [Candidatus Bipolaricaulota bacterium]|nr:dipeptide epimerase [Candidatus Bipolaricaulota bacterium]
MTKVRIERAEVFLFRFSLEKPFRIALGTTMEKMEIIVALHDNHGRVGWGEASPSAVILGCTPDSVLAALDLLIPLVLGEDPRRIRYLVDKMDRALLGNAAAKAALDLALHDLVGQIYGEPVWRFLGGSFAEPLETDFTVGIDEPGKMAEEAKALVQAGFRAIKVKVGEDPAKDVERVRAVREAIGEKTRMWIDSNQGWTRAQAVWALERMAEYGVEFVEQPVPAEDLEGMAWVRKRSAIPVMADESVHSPQDALRAIRIGDCDYVNIKLMKAGGLLRAKEIATICKNAGVQNMIGGMVESNLSATAAVHFALSEANVVFRDLDLGERPEAKLVSRGGSAIQNGFQVLSDPEAPGFGFQEIRREWLKPVRTYTVGEKIRPGE